MSPHTIGTKYDKNLTTTEIAAKVRADIKAAQKAGTINKGYKISVTKQSFSGGSSITLTIKALPANVNLTTPLYVKQASSLAFVEYYDRALRYTAPVQITLDTLKQMLSAYNFNDSDIQTDYFHVRFYQHVDVDWQLERDVHKAMKAESAGSSATL